MDTTTLCYVENQLCENWGWYVDIDIQNHPSSIIDAYKFQKNRHSYIIEIYSENLVDLKNICVYDRNPYRNIVNKKYSIKNTLETIYEDDEYSENDNMNKIYFKSIYTIFIVGLIVVVVIFII